MKVAAIAALSVLIMHPAQAGQRHRQNGSPMATCDNDGHCTTLSETSPALSYRKSRSEIKRQHRRAHRRSHPLDANGNPVGVVKSTQDRCACSRLRLLMLHVSRLILTIWKTTTVRACCLWAAFGAADVCFRASTHAERP